jgi:hypothetical protein
MTGDWNVYQPAPASGAAGQGPPPARHTREWRVAASPLTRALGRPIRDQVFSTRDSLATTLQALELVNGERLTRSLRRGARHMLGELPPPPASLFMATINARGGRGSGDAAPPGPSSFDVDVSKATRLWLIVQDANSTAIDKAAPVWAQAELVGPGDKMIPLETLKPVDESALRTASGEIILAGAAVRGVRAKAPSRLIYDISGRGFTRFRGMAGLENVAALAQGETVLGRFLIFDTEPDMDRLVPPAPGTPLPADPAMTTAAQVVDRVFWYALGRAPSGEERAIAESVLHERARPGRVSTDGLADFLWAVIMKPEFQLIY